MVSTKFLFKVIRSCLYFVFEKLRPGIIIIALENDLPIFVEI